MNFEIWKKIDSSSYSLLKTTNSQNELDCTIYAGSVFYYKIKDTLTGDWSNEVGVSIEAQQCKVYVVVENGGIKTTYEVNPKVLTGVGTTETAIAYNIIVKIL